MAIPNVITLPKTGKQPRKAAKAPRPHHSSTRQRLALASASEIGLVAVGATILSLSDLAESIEQVAHVATWKGYALATALDMNFVATEAFSLFTSAGVSRETWRATTATKVVTLG